MLCRREYGGSVADRGWEGGNKRGGGGRGGQNKEGGWGGGNQDECEREFTKKINQTLTHRQNIYQIDDRRTFLMYSE